MSEEQRKFSTGDEVQVVDSDSDHYEEQGEVIDYVDGDTVIPEVVVEFDDGESEQFYESGLVFPPDVFQVKYHITQEDVVQWAIEEHGWEIVESEHSGKSLEKDDGDFDHKFIPEYEANSGESLLSLVVRQDGIRFIDVAQFGVWLQDRRNEQ